jgi:MFS family permease
MVTVAAPPIPSIAQRLDRLPLTWPLWRIALVTQAAWGFVIATDGLAARIYPFVWGPQHAFGLAQFSLLLVISTGAGIVIGEFVFALLSDRFGRRRILMIAAAASGLGILPAAFTDNYYLLMLSFGLGAMGIGGVLATNIVYTAEVAPSVARGRMTQTSQALALLLLNLLGTVPAIFLMPGHYQIYIGILAAGPLLVLVPLVAFLLPESPRWLEAHGHYQQAEEAVTRLERLSEARYGILPSPIIGTAVAQPPKARVRDLFGAEYGPRTALLLICWFLGYSGLIYGPLGFLNLYLAREGFSARQVFFAGLISVIGGVGGLLISGRLNERFERKTLILAGAIIASVGLCLVFVATHILHSLLALAVVNILPPAGIYLWLFNMYTYTAVAYPTRIRAIGTGWTDGFGHLGSMASPLIIGALFAATASAGYIGFFAYVIIPGALLPALLLARLGMNQKAAPLEAVAG